MVALRMRSARTRRLSLTCPDGVVESPEEVLLPMRDDVLSTVRNTQEHGYVCERCY